MTKTNRIRLIYGIILTAALIIAGFCLIGACICVYRAGPYTRESVALYFSKIAVPVYMALALSIGSIILNIALPAEKKKKNTYKNVALTLQKLWDRRQIEFCGPTLLKDIRKEQQLRKRILVVSYIILTVFCVVFLIFSGIQVNRFMQIENPLEDISHEGLNKSIIIGAITTIGCLVIPFGYALATVYRTNASITREIALVKGIAPSKEPDVIVQKKDYTNIIRCALLGAAVTSIAYGYFAGGTADVLYKAINICTECVGLG